MKRILSMLMAAVIIFGMIPANVFAENTMQPTSLPNEQGNATVNNENITVTGTNDFGDLISKDIQKEQDAQAEALQTGYDVISLTVNDNTATVEYFAKGEASIVVAIYSEDRTQLLTSGKVDVTADETTTTISLPDTLPEYFHASAYMVSKKDQKPLCSALHTTMYTKDMQELLDSTIYDYNEELVLNLDERTDTNFAVYNEDTVVVEEQTGVNTIVSIDDDTLTYIIDNPSQEIRSLMYGDILSLPYGDENILFVKVDRVNISGNRATITGLPIEMQDVFSHVKIDGTSNGENAEVDTSTADEDVTFEGFSDEPATRALEGDVTSSRSISYNFTKNVKAGVDGKPGELSCQVNGKLKFKLSIEVKYYIALARQEFTFSIENTGSFILGVEGKAKLNIPLGTISIPVVSGVNVGLKPTVVFEVNGKAELTISMTSKFGFSFISGVGIKNISEPLKAETYVEAEITIFVGLDLAPFVSLLDDDICRATLSLPFGIELTAKMTGSAVEGEEALIDNNHTCKLCIDISLDAKIASSIELVLLNSPRLTLKFELCEIKIHLLDGYYSVDRNEFGWRKCPYKLHPLTITVLNSDNQPMEGVTIQFSTKENALTTNAEGKAYTNIVYGAHTLYATKGDYAGSETIDIKGTSSITIRVIITGNVTDDVKWSLSEAGVLTIFGNGGIPNYTDSSQVPWSRYISMVKSVNISGNVTGIGANVFKNHPNLSSVHIGTNVSNVNFTAFEGLNLSKFTISSNNWMYSIDQYGVVYSKNKSKIYKAIFPLSGTYEIPAKVTNIYSKAFAGQTGINVIRFTGNAPSIAADAFSGLTAEAFYSTGSTGWTQDRLQQYGGTITWTSYDVLLGSGTLGSQSSWELYSDGILRISGIGEIPNYTSTTGAPWFKHRANIRTILISDGITSIGDYAFSSLTKLEGITIPSSVVSIGMYAFYNCNKLTDITIPGAVTTISTYSFYKCSSLTSVSIPDSVSVVESYAFYECSNLAEISTLQNVSTVESYAFYGCSGLTRITTLQNVSTIGSYAFCECSNLQSINALKYVTAIEQYSFYNCSSLQDIQLCDGITSIGNYAFYNCSGFTELVVPQTVTDIGEYAFAMCSGVQSLRIRDNFDSDFAGLTIGNFAFANCTSLRSAKISDSTIRINDKVFYGCGNLESISIPFVGDQRRESTASVQYPLGYIFGTSSFTGAVKTVQGRDDTTSGIYYIPSSLKTVIVTDGDIPYYAFKNCSNLESIVIAESTTSIGSYAFENCSSITHFTIPYGVTSIGVGVFYDCRSLTSIAVPDGVTRIGNYAFWGCSSLTSITIPDGVTSIGNYAFYCCKALSNVTIPDSVVEIGESCYLGCSNITSVTLGSGIKNIGDDAFLIGSQLTEVHITDINAWLRINFETEGANPLNNAKKLYLNGTLVTNVYVPEDIEKINSYVFYNCECLTEITIPAGLIEIGKYAFYNCTALSDVTIGEGITTVGEYAFSGCNKLTDITIPNSVTSIGNCAFYKCTGLISISFPFVGDSALTNGEDTDFGYLFGTKQQYNAEGTLVTTYAIPSTLHTVTVTGGIIRKKSFNDCNSLITVNITDDVTVVASGAFSGCGNLQNLSIPGRYLASVIPEIKSTLKTVTVICDTIPSGAFRNCTGLTNVTIGNDVTCITSDAFSGCSNLDYTIYENAKYLGNEENPYYALISATSTSITSCNIHPDTKLIADCAFYSCTKLTGITIPNGVKTIGDEAFYKCTGLSNVNIPNSVTYVGTKAFYSCSNLQYSLYEGGKYLGNSENLYVVLMDTDSTTMTTFVIHPDTKIIYYEAVRDCKQLTEITIPHGVISIGNYAFYYCNKMTNVSIPETVTYIGSYAFYYCSQLTGMDIPSGITAIEDYTFYSCYNLKNLIIPDGVTSIGAYAFYGCDRLNSLVVPASVSSIGEKAFYMCNGLDEITFQGDAPSLGSSVFSCNFATVYYPSGNVTWTNRVMQNIGSSLTWVEYTPAKETRYTNRNEQDMVLVVDDEGLEVREVETTTEPEIEAFLDVSPSMTSTKSMTRSGYLKMRTVSFEGLDPGEEYIFLSLVSENEENPLIYENLLYIDQLCADENGVITISYIPRFESDTVFELVSGGALKNLAEATVTWPEYTENGSQQFFVPTVIYNGETLRENVDYVLEGDISFCVPGSYHCYVVGIGDYIGSYACSYEVTAMSEIVSEGLNYKLNEDGTYYVSGIGTCTDTDIIIPAEYNGLPVTEIGNRAFYKCSSLTSITIPDSVTSIAACAFEYCSSLTSITIPDSVTGISSSVFYRCSSLTSIMIPDGVTSIGASAFAYCSSLTSITIPDSVTSIGSYAFEYCSSLTSITIPDGVPSIGSGAFYRCSSLTSITIPDGVTSIGSKAFGYCSSLTSITIPDSVTSIGNSAFEGCGSLTSITIPDGVTSIGNDAFYDCSRLTSIAIPDSVTSIGSYAFGYCSSLTSITIPDSVTSIGSGAFSYCSSLTSITIPDGVTTIGHYAFSYCSSLTSITIPDGVTGIGNYAFRSCSSLTSITIPDSVTSIGNDAFSYCSSLTSITIPDGVTSIGNYAFRGCGKMTEIIFEGDASTIGSNAFYGVSATAYYNPGDTWTESVMQNYGGNITWVPMQTTVVDRWNLVLEDDLKVNFYLNLDDDDSLQITVGNDSYTYRVSELEKADDGKRIVSVNVAAAQMTEEIRIQVAGSEEILTYTIREYCQRILADENYSQYHALVKQMLHYGAMAQVYFGYLVMDLANDGITGVASEEVPETAEEMTVSDKIIGLNFYGASLVYRDRIAVRYYFTGDVTGCTFVANGNTYTPVAKDGMYYIEIADILPQDLDQQITLTVTDASSNTLSVTYGPMNYIVRMNQKGTETLQDLLKALYNYHLAAKALTA